MTDYNARNSYETWSASGKPSMMDELKPKVHEILTSHIPLPLDEDIEHELDKIEQRAREGIKIV
jgi:trimethylamine:corrinoid methyltransferase-like protein